MQFAGAPNAIVEETVARAAQEQGRETVPARVAAETPAIAAGGPAQGWRKTAAAALNRVRIGAERPRPEI